MNRAVASVSALLLLASLAGAGDESQRVAVPAGKAPSVDGALDDGEWADALAFRVARGEQLLGDGWMKREGRDLFVGYRSVLPPFTLNLRFAFSDPSTGRRVLVHATPLSPPFPPLLLYRQSAKGPPERATAATCDVRYGLRGPEGFVAELRLPLDELEIGRPAKDYGFYLQVWSLESNNALGAFPVTAQGSFAQPVPCTLAADPDWGLEAPAREPRVNAALALLEEVWRESEWEQGGGRGDPPARVIVPYLGVRDGKRSSAPLLELEKRLAAMIEAYPDYPSLLAQQFRAHVGLNDLDGALRSLRAIGESFPAVGASGRHVMLVLRMLRDMGRFDEALAMFDANAAALMDQPDPEELRAALVSLRDQMEAEKRYREEDARRGDLPRVRFKTSRGDVLLELFEDDAPNAVSNFITLVEAGFYDGTRFHWAESGGQIIGGDPNSRNEDRADDGFGGPGYMIESEPGRRVHLPWTIAYVDKQRTRRTEGSAFVIAIAPLPILDGYSTVFGRVVDGFDVVRRIEYYDSIATATVERKRSHAYRVQKRA